MRLKLQISVILATYNRTDALALVLQSLDTQTDKNFEVVIADDGSREDTKFLIEQFRRTSRLAIQHVWHEDHGFRLAKIRNLAIASSTGDYLIFLDGDCITQPDFIARHQTLKEQNFLVTGSRILLGKKLTKQICDSGIWNFSSFRRSALPNKIMGQLNKISSLFFKVPDNRWRIYSKFVWRRIKGCNLACWKSDAQAIGGFDEELVGWGHEDADFVFRLQTHQKVLRKSGAFATEILHLWHPIGDRSQAEKNEAIVRAKILAKG